MKHCDGINQLDAQVATAQGSEWDYVLLSTVRPRRDARVIEIATSKWRNLCKCYKCGVAQTLQTCKKSFFGSQRASDEPLLGDRGTIGVCIEFKKRNQHKINMS